MKNKVQSEELESMTAPVVMIIRYESRVTSTKQFVVEIFSSRSNAAATLDLICSAGSAVAARFPLLATNQPFKSDRVLLLNFSPRVYHGSLKKSHTSFTCAFKIFTYVEKLPILIYRQQNECILSICAAAAVPALQSFRCPLLSGLWLQDRVRARLHSR